MKGIGQASAKWHRDIFALSVNRLAYTLQSHKPGANGKHYYYRPEAGSALVAQTIREHLKRSADRWPVRTGIQIRSAACG